MSGQEAGDTPLNTGNVGRMYKEGRSAPAPASTQPSASLEFPLEVTFPPPRATH